MDESGVQMMQGLLLATFSITGRCPESRDLGVAVSTAVPNVGSLCPWVSRNAAVATQSFVNVDLGAQGIRLADLGMPVHLGLRALLDADPEREIRQLHGIDRDGNVFTFSGSQCVDWYGHKEGENHTVAGNMLVGEETLAAMQASFQETAGQGLELAERLLRALEAGQAAGGDNRGRESAALLVASDQPRLYHHLRVDQHADPVAELRRIHDTVRRRQQELEKQYGVEAVRRLSRVKY